MPRSPITTHVLDTAQGRPAAGVGIKLEKKAADGWKILAEGVTDSDGRATNLLAEGSLESGIYRITFDTAAYFGNGSGFYPYVPVIFEIKNTGEHYHVPLLISPFGYSTYRGS